ncbi:acyltransferase domain-containing protein [Streptomyces mirabilis]|nr:acyltransferase domain-containing protein [Streptomyces mirabilis]
MILEEAPTPAPARRTVGGPRAAAAVRPHPEALLASARAFRDHLTEHPGPTPPTCSSPPRSGDGTWNTDWWSPRRPAARRRRWTPSYGARRGVRARCRRGGGGHGTGVPLHRPGQRVRRDGRGARRAVPGGGPHVGGVRGIHRDETGRRVPRPVAGRRRRWSRGGSAGPGPEGARVWDTAFAQPALFALQVAQARLWRRFGVEPVAVAGHSAGEYAAPGVAGALTLEDGLRLVCRRGG